MRAYGPPLYGVTFGGCASVGAAGYIRSSGCGGTTSHRHDAESNKAAPAFHTHQALAGDTHIGSF